MQDAAACDDMSGIKGVAIAALVSCTAAPELISSLLDCPKVAGLCKVLVCRHGAATA